MFKVVSTHLVESVLRSQDVVHKVEDDEAVVDDVDDVDLLLLFAADGGILPGELVGFEVDDHFFQVEAVDRNNVCLQVVFLAAFHLVFYAVLGVVFLGGRLYIHFGDDELFDFGGETVCEVGIHGLLEDGVASYECFDALDDVFVFEFFEVMGDELFFFGHFVFVLGIVDVDVDAVAVGVLDVDIDVDVLSVVAV